MCGRKFEPLDKISYFGQTKNDILNNMFLVYLMIDYERLELEDL